MRTTHIPPKKSLYAAGAIFALFTLAAHAAPQLTVIADGLNCPRGLAFAPNGRLYVAEAGAGAGGGQGGFGVGVGFTGSITEITDANTAQPTAQRIVTGLVSVGDTENGSPDVVGADGVSIQGSGGIYVIMADSTPGIAAHNPDLPAAAAAELGRLLKVTPSGQWDVRADVGSFSYAWTLANQNASWAPAGQFPDANPYGVLAVPGRQYVVDAAANTLNEVSADGSIRLIAYFPNPLFPPPSGGPAVIPISDAVPTCVALGPDGFLYVGTLAFGANFARFSPTAPPLWHTLPPQSKVYRVDPTRSNQFLSDADVWASDFNPIVACAFGTNGLYVTEFVTQQSNFITGDVVRVGRNSDGSSGARTVFGAGALAAPNGLALGPGDAIYVSNLSISVGGGEVVRVNY